MTYRRAIQGRRVYNEDAINSFNTGRGPDSIEYLRSAPPGVITGDGDIPEVDPRVTMVMDDIFVQLFRDKIIAGEGTAQAESTRLVRQRIGQFYGQVFGERPPVPMMDVSTPG